MKPQKAPFGTDTAIFLCSLEPNSCAELASAASSRTIIHTHPKLGQEVALTRKLSNGSNPVWNSPKVHETGSVQLRVWDARSCRRIKEPRCLTEVGVDHFSLGKFPGQFDLGLDVSSSRQLSESWNLRQTLSVRFDGGGKFEKHVLWPLPEDKLR